MSNYHVLSGSVTTTVLLWGLIYAFLGFVAYKMYSAATRDKSSTRTPEKWSWKFWWDDNKSEAIRHALFMILAVRFLPDIINLLTMLGILPTSFLEFLQKADNMFVYLLIGVVIAMPIETVKKAASTKASKKDS